MAAKEIKFLDYQEFSTEEARKRYYEKMKDSYEFVFFYKENNKFCLNFYDEKTETDKWIEKGYIPLDPIAFGFRERD